MSTSEPPRYGKIALYRGWKTDARNLCRMIARDTPDGPVTGPDGDFLAALLTRHPDAQQKTGSGIARITVGAVPGHPNTRGFTVHRIDGSSTDFSWLDCITEPSHRARVLKAMRKAVVPQILAFKQAEADAGRLCSAITGAKLSWNEAEVDHYPVAFITLADAYAEAAGEYSKIPLEDSRDGQIGRRLESWHETTWARYHQQNAQLRIVSGPENRP